MSVANSGNSDEYGIAVGRDLKLPDSDSKRNLLFHLSYETVELY